MIFLPTHCQMFEDQKVTGDWCSLNDDNGLRCFHHQLFRICIFYIATATPKQIEKRAVSQHFLINQYIQYVFQDFSRGWPFSTSYSADLFGRMTQSPQSSLLVLPRVPSAEVPAVASKGRAQLTIYDYGLICDAVAAWYPLSHGCRCHETSQFYRGYISTHCPPAIGSRGHRLACGSTRMHKDPWPTATVRPWCHCWIRCAMYQRASHATTV